MSQLDRLKQRLAAQRQVTLAHPLDDTVTIVHRPPTPEDDDRNFASRPSTIAEVLPCHAGLLADTVVAIQVDGEQVADHYGMDVATMLGIEWVQGTTTAVDVVRAFYGDAWEALISHGRRVRLLASGGGADPLD